MNIRDRGRLPHWENENATYFITFRLADSLPQSVLDRIASERKSILELARQQSRPFTLMEADHLKRLSTIRVQQYLDAGAGSCALRIPEVANEVAKALTLFDEKRYRMFAWCVMPNHVHVVARVFPPCHLSEVLHSWKSFTAKAANKRLSAHGTFWQREYCDHLLRDETEFQRAVKYVVENPNKAKLQDWPWVWMRGQVARATAGEGAGATVQIPTLGHKP